MYVFGIPQKFPWQELGRDVALTAGDIALAQRARRETRVFWGIPFAPCGVVLIVCAATKRKSRLVPSRTIVQYAAWSAGWVMHKGLVSENHPNTGVRFQVIGKLCSARAI